MKKWNVILGADVSKLTLDISSYELEVHIKIDNCSQGFKVFQKWCKTHKINLKDTLIVMEYTGGYEYKFIQFCEAFSIAYYRVPGLEIKNSMGMTRGKSDETDSFRISRYGEQRIKDIEPAKPLNKIILTLKQLLSFRKRLVRENAGYQSTLSERRCMYEIKTTDTITRTVKAKIKSNMAYIKQIEKDITAIIKTDEDMLLNYRIITSIKGIGKINAWMTIAYTENFTSFPDARTYAVYVGVLPFGHKSGTSLKGRPKVSNLANKELKQELNQAAKTAIAHDPELRAYAERKFKNKCYPLVLNNVKFKLILRMFSLVKRHELYIENYRKSA